jgi:beta-xylosidase
MGCWRRRACRITAFAALAAGWCGCAHAATLSYANPLPFRYESQGRTLGEVRDPCIIREDDRWYAVFTMHPFRPRDEKSFAEPDQGSAPGIRIYSTTDFRQWRDDGWLVKSAELPEDCPYKHQFWAPEIHRFGGKHYLVFTASNWNAKRLGLQEGYYAFIGVADHAAGPYRHIAKVPDGPCDSTLFADDDGAFYLAMPRRDIAVQRVDLGRLDQGVITRVGVEAKVVAASSADIGAPVSPEYLEGPWVERIGARYCLFYAANYGKEGYWTGVAYADRPLGPYRKDPRGKVFLGGHLAVFAGPDGRRWFSYRGEGADAARGLLCIDPFTIDGAGLVQAAATCGIEVTVPREP